MSRGQVLSVLGLYHWDNTLFDEMMFPEDFTADNKQTVIGNILSECAELEILFPDAPMCKTMIGLWSKLNVPVWDRIYKASLLEYNPIENYNRTEDETISNDKTSTHTGNDVMAHSGSDSKTLSNTGSETHSGTDTTTISNTIAETNSGSDNKSLSSTGSETNSGSDTTLTTTTNSGTDTTTTSETHSGTDTTTNSQTAYDSSASYIHDTTDVLHGHRISGSQSTSHGHSVSGSESLTHGHKVDTSVTGSEGTTYGHKVDTSTSGSEGTTYGHKVDTTGSGSEGITYGKRETFTHGETVTDEGDITRHTHISGNIGTMTTQQMLTSEVELAPILNVMKIICDSFKERFCILVY